MKAAEDKPLVWLRGEVKTPPFTLTLGLRPVSCCGVCSAGKIWRCLIPDQCRPSAPRCHELRVQDQDKSWRIVCRIDGDAIVILEVFRKTTQQTPLRVIEDCKRRLRNYEATKSSKD